ncbi:MAG: hypothetical protein H0T43_02660 [Solirubrobacterales bacterium]|nr:hypothetical protein [Solirubrobacterales bacterium]
MSRYAIITRTCRCWVLATVAGGLVAAAPAQAQERPRARAVDGVAGIVEAFKRYPLVAVDENHGDVGEHEFLRKLVTDPRVARAADVIVIEAGSAAQQRAVDRFVAGERVSRKALAATWRDSIGGGALGTWDAPIYEQFLRAIRRANRGRPAEQRLRVVLADPPVEWKKVRTAQQFNRWAVQRDSHYAAVVNREVMAKGRRALLIAGLFHFLRDAGVPQPTALMRIDEQHPGKAYHVALPPFDPAMEYGAAYEYMKSFPAGSLVALAGTDLGALRQPRPPQAPQAPTQEEHADAWLLPPDRGLISNAYPTAFEDTWWRELIRRNQLGGVKFEPAKIFAHQCVYSTLQGTGLRQATQMGPSSGEPRLRGSVATGAQPKSADAASAVAAQLRAGKVAAIGDARALGQQHAFLRKLIASGQLPGRPSIVVDFGNSRHQRLVDAYLSGVDVPLGTLARVWQDTSQLIAYDAPAYEDFFKAVRDANRRLPAQRRIRVLLGEPPLRWESTRSRGAVRKVVARRAAFMARLVKRQIAKERSVVVVADRDLVARVPGSITGRLPAGKSWVLQPHVGFGGNQSALEGKLGEPAAPSALTIRGSWLESLQSGRNLGGSRSGRDLGRTADALLYLGRPDALQTMTPLPTPFRDRYVRAIRHRHRLLFGASFDPARAFPTSSCVGAVESVHG